MVFRLAAAAGALLAAASAAEPALQHATAPLLVAAAEKARAHADNLYAFTLEQWVSNGEKEGTVTLRYDPRLPKGEQWKVLSPSEDDLDKDAKKALKKARETEMEDNPVLYERLDEIIEEAAFVEETQTEAVFVAQVDDCLLYTSPSPRDLSTSRMPSSA